MITINLSSHDNGHQSLTVFLLCAVFFFTAIVLALAGSSLYRSVAAAADRSYTARTALSYLTNQVRRGDTQDGLSVSAFGDGDALVLTETDGDGFSYLTRLYCYEGSLYELYTPSDVALSPEDGTALLDLSGLSIDWSGGLLTFTITDESGWSQAISVAPHCEVEGTL